MYITLMTEANYQIETNLSHSNLLWLMSTFPVLHRHSGERMIEIPERIIYFTPLQHSFHLSLMVFALFGQVTLIRSPHSYVPQNQKVKYNII